MFNVGRCPASDALRSYTIFALLPNGMAHDQGEKVETT